MTRPTGARERVQMVRTLRSRFGRQVVELRTDAGVTRPELARCADVDTGHLWRIEAGQASPSLDLMAGLAICLGSELGLRFFPSGGPRLHDRFQAPMLEALIGILGAPWRPQPEVAAPAARGVIDLVLSRSEDRLAVACECHSELRRLELALRRLGEKEEALRGQLEPGWTASRMLLLRSTAATRSIARAFEATLAAAFPARTVEALAALEGEAAWPGPAIVWARVEANRAEILQGPPRGVRVGR